MKYDKLVRDQIPDLIVRTGKTCSYRSVVGDEYKQYLRKKLDEEVGEFKATPSMEELVDIYEVVLALAEEFELNLQGLDAALMAKRSQRGGFRRGYVLVSVDDPHLAREKA